MKNVNSTVIASATSAIRAAGIAALDIVTTARASLALVIREQVALLEKAGVPVKVISATVREALAGLAKPGTINKALIRAGVRLRGKRSDAACLKSADSLISLSLKGDKPKGDDKPKAPGDKAPGDKTDDKGDGHTVATLAALLASLPEALVNEAVSLARRNRAK